MKSLICWSVTCRPAKELVLSKEKPISYQPPLPPNEAPSGIDAAAGVTPVGLRPPFVTPAAAHSHPDCRGIPILIVAPQRRVQHQRPTRVDVRRPEEDAVLEPLGEEAEAGAIPEHNFDEVGLPTPEHEDMAREGILPQHALDQHRKPIDAFAHVDIAEGQVHLHARRKQRHDVRSSVGGVVSTISTATNSGATSVRSNGTGHAPLCHSDAPPPTGW